MFKLLSVILLSTLLSSNQEMMEMFESIKKQERALILQNFKEEKALRFNLRSKPRFYRGKSKKQANFQQKDGLSKKLKGKRN